MIESKIIKVKTTARHYILLATRAKEDLTREGDLVKEWQMDGEVILTLIQDSGLYGWAVHLSREWPYLLHTFPRYEGAVLKAVHNTLREKWDAIQSGDIIDLAEEEA